MNALIPTSSLSYTLMLVTNRLTNSSAGGRELLCKLNHDALKEIYGDRLTVFELIKKTVRTPDTIVKAFGGYIDGINTESISAALEEIRTKDVQKIFVDGSNFGKLVEIIKTKFPNVEIFTFFHNVEARFFYGALKQTMTPRALAVLAANYLAEKSAVRYSDKIICMSQRDSSVLQKLYGRSATHVSPMALEDKLPADIGQSNKPSREKFALFVGGTFYANRAGITWFVKHVAPRIQIRTCIVGRGFEALRQELECDGKVEVIGAVDHLADWYRDAHFVIAPIFDGSGMKTKVAEALMYGKKIIGTPEAFSGYEGVAEQAGWVCATEAEFMAAITEAENEVTQSFYPELRMLYDEKYSFAAAVTRLAAILANDCVLPIRRDSASNNKI